MNLLERYFDDLREYKWKNGQTYPPYYDHSAKIVTLLSDFFDLDDFEEHKYAPQNSIFPLLLKRGAISYFLLGQVAELLAYLKIKNQESHYLFRKSNGKFNYVQLEANLFELYINYLLSESGFIPLAGEEYVNKKGNSKQIDIKISLSNEEYNVEITKLYDPFKDGVVNIASQILRELVRTERSRSIQLHEYFSGFIGFKGTDESTFKGALEQFQKHIKQYLHIFREGTNSALLPKESDYSRYLMVIESAYSNNYGSYYDEISSDFPGFVKFQLKGDLKTNQLHIDVSPSIRESFESISQRFVEKVIDKVKQHRDYLGKKLIVIGVDEIFNPYSKGAVAAVDLRAIDFSAVLKVIDKDTIVWLVLRNFRTTEFKFDYYFIRHQQTHDELVAQLQNIKFLISPKYLGELEVQL